MQRRTTKPKSRQKRAEELCHLEEGVWSELSKSSQKAYLDMVDKELQASIATIEENCAMINEWWKGAKLENEHIEAYIRSHLLTAAICLGSIAETTYNEDIASVLQELYPKPH